MQTSSPIPDPIETPPLHDGALWVFGYGSLIWRPGFAHTGSHPALLSGYHRRFCLWSHHYRGTPEAPGLVLGLDRGGACRGVLFRVPAAEAPAVLRYLDERELPDGAEVVYHRRVLRVRRMDLPGSPALPAVTYVANRACRLYVRDLPESAAAQAIARGVGRMGPNRDYLLNTLRHLADMGVRDRGLARLAALLPGDAEPG